MPYVIISEAGALRLVDAPFMFGALIPFFSRLRKGVARESCGMAVTMPLVLTAARAEFRKLDKPINEGDFRLLEQAAGMAAGAGTRAGNL